jgi:hypothetical protein
MSNFFDKLFNKKSKQEKYIPVDDIDRNDPPKGNEDFSAVYKEHIDNNRDYIKHLEDRMNETIQYYRIYSCSIR